MGEKGGCLLQNYYYRPFTPQPEHRIGRVFTADRTFRERRAEPNQLSLNPVSPRHSVNLSVNRNKLKRPEIVHTNHLKRQFIGCINLEGVGCAQAETESGEVDVEVTLAD